MTTPDRTRARLAGLLLAVTLAVVGCDDGGGDEPPGPAGAEGGTATGAGRHADVFPGLYLTDEVVVSEQGPGWLRLVTALPCAQVQRMLVAGQWRELDRLTVPAEASGMSGLGLPPGVLLGYGDQLAYLAVRGDNSCTATVSAVQRAEIALRGEGMPKAGPGWVATVNCLRSEQQLSVSLMFDTDARTGGYLSVELAADGDGYRVDAEKSESVNLLRHSSRLLASYSKAMAGGDPEADFDGAWELFLSEAGGTVTADPGQSAQQPAGIISLTGLLDENGRGPAELTVPFRCAQVSEVG